MVTDCAAATAYVAKVKEVNGIIKSWTAAVGGRGRLPLQATSATGTPCCCAVVAEGQNGLKQR
jgi:hypothetical protein